MVFLGWFRRKNDVCTASSKQADEVSEFYASIFEKKIDLLPAAKEVASLAESGTIDAKTLAKYTMKYGDGTYIRKADIPDGLDSELLHHLISRTILWARWPHRKDQLQDPALQKCFSHVELIVCDNCEPTLGFRGKKMAFAEVVRIPFDSVPATNGCSCTYRTIRKRREDSG